MNNQNKIIKNYALLSVSDKNGLESIARAFEEMGHTLLATGGTYSALKERGFEVLEVSELTQEPERFGGRLKTLHHMILGGILFRPGLDESEWPYDFRIGALVCNFYPFEAKARELSSLESVREWIDIGGPNMVRAAAKNYQHVWVLTSPSQYTRFIANPKIVDSYRERLAAEAFEATAHYNQVISDEFNFKLVSAQVWSNATKNSELRYGENPQQSSKFYPNKKLGLKLYGDWSYNNVRDADAALRFLRVWGKQAAACVVKHQTLCGAALNVSKESSELINDQVFEEAWEGDTVSRFGGVIGFNHIPSKKVLDLLLSKFVEVLLLPKNSEMEHWASRVSVDKARLKIALINSQEFEKAEIQEKEIWSSSFGKLIQSVDAPTFLSSNPSSHSSERTAVDFGEWTAACIKSNAITLVGVKNSIAVLVGAGGGQPNRIDSLEKLALPRALDFCARQSIDIKSLTCFSDAFLPFDDVIRVLAKNSIFKLVQPGGSKNDELNAKTAKELGVEMLIRPPRHFWH